MLMSHIFDRKLKHRAPSAIQFCNKIKYRLLNTFTMDTLLILPLPSSDVSKYYFIVFTQIKK